MKGMVTPMKKRLLSLFLAGASLFCSLPGIWASSPDTGELTIIAELPEQADPALAEQFLLACDPDARLYGRYDTLFNGFAARTDEASARKLAGSGLITAVYESADWQRPAAEEGPAEPTADALANLNDNLPYRGEGMVVAILDTCFDENHEMFTLSDPDCAALSERDIAALVESGDLRFSEYFLSGKGKGTLPYINEKIPYAYDYAAIDADVSGPDNHGTHVAGIIAANNADALPIGFDGVAPEAQLLLMKVWDEARDSIHDFAVLYALEDAIKLGADVINMSFGTPGGSSSLVFSSFDYTRAINAAQKAGISIVAAAGNDSRLGSESNFDRSEGISLPLAAHPDYGMVSTPSNLTGVLSAASAARNVYAVTQYISLHDQTPLLYNLPDIRIDLSRWEGKEVSYVMVKGTGTYEECRSAKVKGRFAVIERGTLPFAEKAVNAQRAGAIGVIIYNNEASENALTMALSGSGCTIPVVFVTARSGKLLAEADTKKLTFISEAKTIMTTDTAKGEEHPPVAMSAFSAWGTTNTLQIKPEITAFGSNIYSTVPGGYGILSGTSMSAPYISGAAALVRQMLRETGRKDDDTLLVRQILMSYARPLINSENKTAYSPRLQGAGLCDLSRALYADAVLIGSDDLPKLQLGEDLKQEFTLSFTVRNDSDTDRIYHPDTVLLREETREIAVDGVSHTFLTGNSVAVTTAKITAPDVTVKAGQSARVTVTVSLPDKEWSALQKLFPNGFFLEGFVTLTDEAGQTLSLPYMGFAGDWGSAPVLEGKPNDDSSFYSQDVITNITIDNQRITVQLGKSAFLPGDMVNPALIAFSPDADQNGDYLSLVLRPLRSAANYNYVIYDEAGEIVLSANGNGLLEKCYEKTAIAQLNATVLTEIWNGGDGHHPRYVLPDGRYTVLFELFPAGGKMQTWSFDLMLDTADPVLSDAWLTTAGSKTTLHVTLSDEGTAIQYAGVYLADVQAGEAYTPAALKAGEKVTVSFDLGDLARKEYVYLDVLDFAFNSTTLRLDLSDLPVRN